MADRTVRFTGHGTPGDLLDANNWAGDAVPGLANTALITMDVGGPVSGTFTVNTMMLLGTEDIVFTGALDTAGVGNCRGLMVCDGATATFTPGAVLNDGNVLIVGNDAAGTLLAQGSANLHSVLNTVKANIGKQDDGSGQVTIDGAIWNNSGHVVIGDKGDGTLDVINAGSVRIGGSVGMAVAAGSSGTLAIAGGGSVSVTGALAAGEAGTALVSVASGSSLLVDKALSVGAGSVLTLAGGTVTGGAVSGGIRILAGGVIAGFGTLAAPDGVAIKDAGTIVASGGTLDVAGNVKGAGSIQIAADSTAVLGGSSLRLADIRFIGSDATLSLAHGSNVTAAISGFAIGDMITMANIDAVSFNPSTNVLLLSQNNVVVESLNLAGTFTGDTFEVDQSAGVATITLRHS